MIKRRTIGELLKEKSDTVHESVGSMDGRVVLGIDPGTNFMGYAVIKVEGTEMKCLELGVITLNKLRDPYRKLATIFQRIGAVADRFHPTEFALEAPFYGKNVQSMLKLGRAQGVAMAAGLSRGMDVFEYPPLRVKQAVTGVGRASKEQVASIMERLFSADFSGEKLDATDALAVAVCHIQTSQKRLLPDSQPKNTRKKKSSSWNTYINNNKDKVL